MDAAAILRRAFGGAAGEARRNAEVVRQLAHDRLRMTDARDGKAAAFEAWLGEARDAPRAGG